MKACSLVSCMIFTITVALLVVLLIGTVHAQEISMKINGVVYHAHYNDEAKILIVTKGKSITLGPLMSKEETAVFLKTRSAKKREIKIANTKPAKPTSIANPFEALFKNSRSRRE